MKALILDDASSILLVSLSTRLPSLEFIRVNEAAATPPGKALHLGFRRRSSEGRKGRFLEEKCEIVKRDDAGKSPVCDNFASLRISTMGKLSDDKMMLYFSHIKSSY